MSTTRLRHVGEGSQLACLVSYVASRKHIDGGDRYRGRRLSSLQRIWPKDGLSRRSWRGGSGSVHLIYALASWILEQTSHPVVQMFSQLMLNEPDWQAVFAPEGRLLREGEIIRRTNLSRTLEAIAKQGPDAFYKGPIADAIIDKIRATGGILTHQDLEDYKVHVSRALQGTYRGRKIYTPHAPTSGPVLQHMLNLMEHYDDLVKDGRTVLNVHRLVEAMKCEYFSSRNCSFC